MIDSGSRSVVLRPSAGHLLDMQVVGLYRIRNSDTAICVFNKVSREFDAHSKAHELLWLMSLWQDKRELQPENSGKASLRMFGLRSEYWEGTCHVSNLGRHILWRGNRTEKTLRQKSLVSVRHRKKANVAGASWERGRMAWDHDEEAHRALSWSRWFASIWRKSKNHKKTVCSLEEQIIKNSTLRKTFMLSLKDDDFQINK